MLKYLQHDHFSTELGDVRRCCLPQAAPDAATTLRLDDSLLTSSSQIDFFFFFWITLPAHPHESRQTKGMPCEPVRTAAVVWSWKLCPERNVTRPQTARTGSTAAKFHCSSLGAWKNYQGFYWASDFIYCDFYFFAWKDRRTNADRGNYAQCDYTALTHWLKQVLERNHMENNHMVPVSPVTSCSGSVMLVALWGYSGC